MLRMIIVAISSLLLLGCNAPEKPVVEIGQMDFLQSQMLCGLTDGSDAIHREPLSTYDRSTCFKPSEWEKVQNYLHLMEIYIKNGCK